MPDTFRCFLVTKAGKDDIRAEVTERPLGELPDGDVLIRVRYSSLNYKDGLAARGHAGVVRKFPHVPGIDAAGVVAESRNKNFPVGSEVVVTGCELGQERWGGWGEYVRVSSDWIVPRPAELSLEECMIYGTAGVTAALCIHALRHYDVTPDRGEVIVTGATGGVGSLAVRILARLGYNVAAVTGKKDKHDWLKQIGATSILGRNDVIDTSTKPLLSGRWAGAVDTVGGITLGTLLRSMKPAGCVSACGLVGGTDLPTTVYPFILRGVTLCGIDSGWPPHERRLAVWKHLATDWKPDHLHDEVHRVSLDGLPAAVSEILKGDTAGRVVVTLGA